MTAEPLHNNEFEAQRAAIARMRQESLESIDVDLMQFDTTYDVNSDVAREIRSSFGRALPHDLSEAEIESLTRRVGQVYSDETTDTRTQVRFLKWLVSATSESKAGSGTDVITARSAESVLWKSLGTRGKLGAISLKFSHLISH